MTDLRPIRLRCSLALLLLFSAFCHSATVPLQPVPYVIHVVVDALTASYLENYISNAPSEFPNFLRLQQEGAFTFNARTDYDETTTTANHACIFTGRPAHQPQGQPDTVHHGYTYNDPDPNGSIHRDGNPNVLYKASVFDIVHECGLSTAFYASKVKLRAFTNSWNEANGRPGPYGRNKIDFAMITDALTNAPSYEASEPLVDSLLEHLAATPFNYTFLHFEETDYVGHYFGWGRTEWSNAVRHVDGQLGRIFEAIETEPSLANRVILMVTADHGGGGSFAGFSHDSVVNILDYRMPFFIWGPGIPPGVDLYTLLANRADPGTNRLDYSHLPQPLRTGDGGNLALAFLGLSPIPGSTLIPKLNSICYSVKQTLIEGQLAVMWPVGAEGWSLESTDSLAPSTQWQKITSDVVTNGVWKIYVLPESGNQFFRLRKQ